MRILSFDLGCTSRKATKTDLTVLDIETGETIRSSIPTTATALVSAIKTHRPDRVVMEITLGTGWVVDLCRAAGVGEIQVVNPMDEAWRNRTSKTDRRDADLLAKLSAVGQVRTVHVPTKDVRQWRELIACRQRLVRDRTALKCQIKSILRSEGLPTSNLWTVTGMASLTALAVPLSTCAAAEMWKGRLFLALERLKELAAHAKTVDVRLERLTEASPLAMELMKLDGIGPRTAETAVAVFDDPLRFRNRKDVGAYVGLVPRVHQSGSTNRHGAITKAGHAVLRSLLVEIVHLAIARPGWIKDIYDKIQRGDKTRKHRAVVATARRVAVILWAKCRDHRRANPTLTTLHLAA